MSEGPNASTALSAFLRGVERRAALFAQLQVGSAESGDAALTGYCYAGRKVFCVMYFQTKVPC